VWVLNQKANNLEEACCGIRNKLDFYSIKENREELIKEIEPDLDLFIRAFEKLKSSIDHYTPLYKQ